MTDEKAYRRAWRAWALYDVGNSAFFLVVVAAVFPVFYLDLCEKASFTNGKSALATTAGVAALIVALLGPILGAAADRTASKKRFLAAFAGIGIVSSALMALIGPGSLTFGLGLYALGTIGVAGSLVFYDALLPAVAREGDLDRISTIGFAWGYGGSVLLFILDALIIMHPGWLGLPDASAAMRVSFLTVAVWWAAFTVPILRRVPEPPATGRGGNVVIEGFRQLAGTLRKLRSYRQLLLFLIAFWLFIDGVDTIIKLATPFGVSIGIAKEHLLGALIATQIVGVPCALAFGLLAKRIGAKAGILIGLGGYVGVCTAALFVYEAWHFYALAIGVGLVQGGVQALSRSLFASMTPKGQSGEFFGFFSTIAKFGGILGPFLLALCWGGEDPNPRHGILAVAVFFVVGGLLLACVNVAAGRRAAGREESAGG